MGGKWENLIYIVDFLEASNHRSVSLLGGEPTIHPNFVDFVEQHGFDVVMRVSVRYPWESELRKNNLGFHDGGIKSTIAIKIRWAVSNAVMQWVKDNRTIFLGVGREARPIADYVVLLVGWFNTPKEQLLEEMAAADIKVVWADDLLAGSGEACGSALQGETGSVAGSADRA